MSDIMNRDRNDLVELPADCEAHVHLWLYDCQRQCWCGERRSDLHARLHESVRMLDGASNVVELSAVRARLARRRG